MGILLWVDDVRQPPDGWTWVKSATDAIRLIDEQEVDEVSLDHDITHVILPGDEPRPGLLYQGVCCPETYEAVARFISVKPGGIKRVHIHTSNPDGAGRMASLIRERQPHIRLSRRLGKIYEEADKDCKVDGQD